MRKYHGLIYYVGGLVCLGLAMFFLVQAGLSPTNLTNRIFAPRQTADHSYRDYYQSPLPLHQNPLRQAAVYLPIYSITEKGDIWAFVDSFGMTDASIRETDDYFLIQNDITTLRIYRFLDLVEFEQLPAATKHAVSNDDAKRIAKEFAAYHLFLHPPFDVEINRKDDEISITITENLGRIPNHAFPTRMTMDAHGNITSVSHFYFEYEEIARGDLMTPAAAASHLPRDHSGIATITAVDLAYIFTQSILQPAYIFRGYHTCGTPFVHHVPAIKIYH